jgi:serine phosphatase RsbU (regulator of sigma subunit)
MVRVSPDRRTVQVWLAGHPAPIVIGPGIRRPLHEAEIGPALGVVPEVGWRAARTTVPAGHWLLLYTDGLIEGRIPDGPDRLGEDGLLELVERLQLEELDEQLLVDRLIDEARALNGGELTDDVAVLLLRWSDEEPV